MFIRCLSTLILVVIFSSPIYAKKIAGVTLPDSVMLSDSSEVTLNGAGIRTKFFFDIYIGALYLTAPMNNSSAIIQNNGAKRVTMHFLYDELEKSKITDAWISGFEDNNSYSRFTNLKPRLMQFNELFSDVKKGDVIHLDYLPGIGTQVKFNGAINGTIAGADFYRALLKVWLGEDPADSDLKEAMVGAGNS